ncbi:hypothetical protein LCGC14_2042000, partial [marine sediment metagenome]
PDRTRPGATRPGATRRDRPGRDKTRRTHKAFATRRDRTGLDDQQHLIRISTIRSLNGMSLRTFMQKAGVSIDTLAEETDMAIEKLTDLFLDVLLPQQIQAGDRTALVKDSGIEVPMELLDRPPQSGIDRNGIFRLVTGNHLFYSGRLSNRSEILTGLLKEPMVEIPHDDAIKLGISNGEKVRVSGSRHEAVLTAKTVCGSKNGVAFIAENFEAIAVNRFFRTGEFMATVTISKVTKDPIRADLKKEGVTTRKRPEV